MTPPHPVCKGLDGEHAPHGELAMRVLTRSDRGFQPRLIDWVDGPLRREGVELDADRCEVAYLIVRVIESYTYLDLILGERPDARRTEPILRLLSALIVVRQRS